MDEKIEAGQASILTSISFGLRSESLMLLRFFVAHSAIADTIARFLTRESTKVRQSTNLGGIESATTVFRDPKLGALLDKFLDQSVPGKGIFDEGVFLKDQRRYLNFVTIGKLLGNTLAATTVIDDYISKGVFYRGLILGCGHCSNVDWFSISDITHTFTCPVVEKPNSTRNQVGDIQMSLLGSHRLDEIDRGAILGHPLGIGTSRRSWRYKLSEVEAAVTSNSEKGARSATPHEVCVLAAEVQANTMRSGSPRSQRRKLNG